MLYLTLNVVFDFSTARFHPSMIPRCSLGFAGGGRRAEALWLYHRRAWIGSLLPYMVWSRGPCHYYLIWCDRGVPAITTLYGMIAGSLPLHLLPYMVWSRGPCQLGFCRQVVSWSLIVYSVWCMDQIHTLYTVYMIYTPYRVHDQVPWYEIHWISCSWANGCTVFAYLAIHYKKTCL